MRAVVEAAPDGMLITDQDGVIELINSQIEVLFGYERDELIGRPVEVLIPFGVRDAHVAHRLRYRHAPTVRSMGIGLSLLGVRKDGSELPVEISLSPMSVSDGQRVIATVRDVSDRLAIESRLRASEEAFRLAFDEAPIGIALADLSHPTERCILRVNAALANMLGRTPDDLVGRTFAEFTHPDDEEEAEQIAGEMVAGTRLEWVREKRYLRSDGSELWCELHANVLQMPDGAGPVSLAHFIDVSERREVERLRERAAIDDQRLALLEDRERIARDLHDLVIQHLFAVGLTLQATSSQVSDAVVERKLLDAVTSIDDTIAQIRTTIFRLASRRAGNSGQLRDQIIRQVDDAAELLGFRPSLHLQGAIEGLSGEIAEALVATLTEALSNVVRHAHATAVEVVVDCRGREAVARVADNGVGLDASRANGNGRVNMCARAADLGGKATVEPRAGGGTVVEWRVPLSRT